MQDTPTTSVQRPKSGDETTIAMVVDAILPQVVDWLGADYDSKEEASLKESLAQACTGWNLDGYKIARNLEQDMWEVDFKLAEILDGYSSYEHGVLNKLVKAWVQEHKPEQKFSVRDKVLYENKEGTVVRVCQEIAEYIVNVPSCGHKDPALDSDGSYYATGFAVAFESLKLTATV